MGRSQLAVGARGAPQRRLERALGALCASAEEHMALLVALWGSQTRLYRDEEEAMTRTVVHLGFPHEERATCAPCEG
jgi:hypothetical protein